MSPKKRQTILLVEDEAIVAMAEKMTLEKYGYTVIPAHSGEEAVTAVEKIPGIDLILMDINLGRGIDGTEAAARILKERDLPVVFLSSHMEPEIVEKTEKITSYGYVVKDSSGTVLDASIKMAFKLFEAKIREMEKESRMEAALAGLKTAEETYRNIFLNAQTGLFRTDIKTGLLLDANDCLARFIGYKDRQELLATPFNIAERYVDYEDRQKMLSQLKEHGEFSNFEVRFKRNDGSIAWIRYAAKIVPEKGWIEGVAEDITKEKAMEESLRDGESRYRSILNASPDGISITDMNGRILMVSPALLALVGCEREEEMLGRSFTDFVFPEDLNRVSSEVSLMSENSKMGLSKYHGLRADGSVVDLEVNGDFIRGADGRPTQMVFIIRDISESKRAEKLTEALYKISQAVYVTGNLNELFEHVHRALSGIIPADNLFIALLSDDGKTLTFPYDIDEKDTGVTPVIDAGNLQSLTVEVLRTKRTLLLDEAELNERYATGRNRVWGTAPKCWLGVPLMIRGTAIGVMAVQDYHQRGVYSLRDVSLLESAAGQIAIAIERKRTEEALAWERFLLEALMNNVPDHVYFKDRDSRFIRINKAHARLFGQNDPAQALGKTDFDFFTEEHARQAYEDEQAIMRTGQPVSKEERETWPDRNDTWVYTTKMPLRDKEGNIIGTFGTSRDITERKQAEAEIKRQLAEKEVLLLEVHHRIKNNIAAIGALLSLQMKSVTNPEAVAALQDAIGRVDSMHILYNKLLASEGYKDIQVKNYVESLCDSVIAMFSGSAMITLDKRIADFQLDSKRLFPLGIIINELLTNKMKYAFSKRDTGLIKIALAKTEKQVALTIEDDGNDLPDGFDINKSTGFGLTLVKMLSQQLHGTFSMARQKGTRCTIEFKI